jgi:aerobic-type carbon monoxide dehydrogenase small subunit (CoxS/CutS family)
MTELCTITLTVNGNSYSAQAEPRKLLSDFLREDLHLTGTHVGCEHGVCGACTVIWDGTAARTCLALAVQADGASLRTVEGMANNGELHPIQEAFREAHGLQCGFCTPGFLMAVSDLLERNPNPSDEEIREDISSNICRCTGDQNIVKAVKLAAEKLGQGV